MKKHKNAFTLFFAALLIIPILLSGCIALQPRFRQSVAPDEGTRRLSGLRDEVVIRRDSLGVPFIEASSEDDLFYAAGYAQASDRLWQMVIMKMTVQGRLSEISGPDTLAIDIFMRTLDVKSHINAALNELDARSRRILKNYARGVNAYIDSHPNLPSEFILAGYKPEPWEEEDSLYIFAMLNLFLSYNFIEELDFLVISRKTGCRNAAWLFPVYPDEPLPFEETGKLSALPRDKLIKLLTGWKALRKELLGVLPMNVPASNNWALAPGKTRSGKTLLANDTHLVLSIPCPWLMMHLKCPTYQAAGVTAPGIPVVTLGYNGKIAWGATMVMADSQDLFIEKLRQTGSGTEYLYKGRWLPLLQKKEIIKIKGKDPCVITLRTTAHGVLLNEALEKIPSKAELPVQPVPFVSSYGIALRWAMEGVGTTLNGFSALARSTTMAGARRAMRDIKSIYLNLVYGNAHNIGWQVTGAVPVRKKGRGLLPSPGWDGEYDWTGFLSFDKLPHTMNPPADYLATANNRTVGRNFPYNISATWYHPDRAGRLREVLGPMRNATLADMEKLQSDRYSPMAAKAQRVIFESPLSKDIAAVIASWKDGKNKRRAQEALRLLSRKNFDSVMDGNSAPAALMGCFFHSLVHRTFLDELGPMGSPLWQSFLDLNAVSYSAPEDHLAGREDSPFWDNVATPGRETKADIIAESLADAVKLCEKRLGSDRSKWRWGKLHTYHWKHDITKKTFLFHGYFNRGPYPAGGDVHTLNVAGFMWGRSFDVWMIPAMRMIVDFSREEPLYLILSVGQSGNPSSPHYADMLPLYLRVKTRPMPFTATGIQNNYTKKLRLIPNR